MTKELTIPYIAELDCLNADAVFNRLESAGVRHSISELNWAEYPYHPLTTFTTAHSGKYIYVNFFVRCNFLRAMNYENNSPVHEDSCVMLYLQPDVDKADYWSFEFNCIGTIKGEHRTVGRTTSLLSDAEIEQISVIPSCVRLPFHEIEGLFTWDLLVVIPLSLIGIKADSHKIRMKGNFYKCASGTSQPHFLSWAPIDSPTPDFHRPESFGEITIE